MGLFKRTRRAESDTFRSNQRTMVPRFTTPPARDTAEWLQTFTTSPRLAVVDKIARDLSGAKGKLFRVGEDGTETEITSHPFLDLMKKPNPLHEFKKTSIWRLQFIYLKVTGESYCIIDQSDGKIELWPVPTHWVMMTPYAGFPFYTVRNSNGLVLNVSVDDMFVMKDLNPVDPYKRGVGQVNQIADEVETDEYASKFQKNFFFNDATPALLFKMPKSTEAERKRFLEFWQNLFRGVRKSHSAAALGDDASVEKLTENMKDLDMINGRVYLRDAALEHFAMPRELMGITESSNRATSDAAQFIYAQNILMPELREREDAINEQLIPMFGDDLIYHFDDIVPRNQEFDKARAIDGWSAGLLMKNEARELLDMPSVEKGNVYKTSIADMFMGEDEDPAEFTESFNQTPELTAPTDTGQPEQDEEYDDFFDTDAQKSQKARIPPLVSKMDLAEATQTGRFEVATAKYFVAQRKRIMDALNGTQKADGSVWDIIKSFIGGAGEEYVDTSAWSALTEDQQAKLVQDFASGLIDWTNESKALFNIFNPLWKESYNLGAKTASDLYKLQSIQRPELVSLAKLRGGARVKGITDSTKSSISRIVSNGIEQGESQATIAKAIEQEMKTTAARARLIANQEAVTSLNAGQYDMMRTAGAGTKTWHHRPQKNPRDGRDGGPNHTAMEGETVPIDAKFSNGLRFPRDPDCADGAQVINCRCYITYGGIGGKQP